MTIWKMSSAALITVVFAGAAFAQASGSAPDKALMRYKSARASLATGDEMVKAAQQALKDQGLDPGVVDGRMGPKTEAALRAFQKAHGMEPTGQLDVKTTDALGMNGKTSSSGASSTAGSASPATLSSPAPSDPADAEKNTDEKS